MIRIIEQTLRSRITDLGFIERWGGVAVPITMDIPGDKRIVRASFPVSCDISATECIEQGKYKNLMPDESYKSVAYLEEQSGARIESGGPKRSNWTSTQTVRFVCWLNMKKLGLDDCLGSDRFSLALADAIVGDWDFSVDGIAGRMEISSLRLVPKNKNQIFPYSYNAQEHVFFWPFDYFAVDFDSRVHINKNCLPTLTLGTEIECLTNW